ncbi:MAG: hypothetical protein ACOX2N_07485 [Peptococcia bacterium]|jgi:hypothetical protein
MTNKLIKKRAFWLVFILILLILGTMLYFKKQSPPSENGLPAQKSVVDGQVKQNKNESNLGETEENNSEQGIVRKNPFDASEINIMDKVCGLTLIDKKISKRNEVYQLDFTGEVKVSGTYEHWGEAGLMTPCISFYPDNDSVNLLPKVNDDDRIVWFNLNDYNKIKGGFSEAKSSGKATIVIDNYIINLREGATSNTADLIKILGIEANSVEATIAERLKKHAKENVVKVFYDDFDGDGVKEAFVLTGELTNKQDECSWSEGKVWFVGQFYEMVQDGLFTHFSFEPSIITLDDIKLLHVPKEYATGCHSFLFGVVKEEPYTYFDYEKGYIYEENGSLLLNNDAYDAYYEADTGMFVGHTYKDYYLYCEKDDDNFKGFREYGAVEISLEQFLKFKGAQDMLEQIKAINNNAEITNILYRENEVINLNYIIRDDLGYAQKNATVNYNDKEVYNFIAGDGKYEKAIIPEIASYPIFKEP